VKIALITLGLLGIATTLLPFLRRDAWWIRIFDFPRLQITFVTATTLVVYLFTGWHSGLADSLFVVAMLSCLGYQGYMMFPYTRLASKQVEQSVNPARDSTLSVMFANVLQDNRQADKLKAIISEIDPDIILAVETNDWWKEQLQSIAGTHPHTVFQAQENTYGMLLFSKLELIDPQVEFLVQDDIPSIHTRVRLLSGDELTLRCLHPRPPFPTEDERSTERDVELLIVGKEVNKLGVPAIVMGDLNDVAWSRTNYLFQDVSGLLDPRIGRGFYHTFHAEYPFMRFPLDHCFHSNHFRLVDFKRLGYYGSDHFPVYIKLSFEPDGAAEQDELQADASKQHEADQKIDQLSGPA